MKLTSTGESFFDFNELFFSRTNPKGIIKSCNSVFQRVSQNQWDELLNKPHNIIRHASMPKGVFHLLWETILGGQPIGSYVINRSKEGGFYWVYALVIPIPEGFLSIRLKPSSPIFEIIKNKYQELLIIEKTQKITPKESQELLLKEIEKLGFKNYHQFMIEALTQELESRQIQLKMPPLGLLQRLRKSLERGKELQIRSEGIAKAYRKSALVPLNLEVQAARIGQEAASIATISSQYESLAKEIQQEIGKFVTAAQLVQDKLQECQFNVCNSLLQREMVSFFREEVAETPIDKEVEMELLETLGQAGIKNAAQSLHEIDSEFWKFKSVYEEVRKLSTALEIVSISGKIEAAKIKQSTGELKSLLNDLGEFKNSLKVSLKEIDEIGRDLVSETQAMKTSFATA